MSAKKRAINWRLILLLTALGAIGNVAIIPYNIALLNKEELLQQGVNLSIPLIMTINTFANTVVVFILVFIGVLLLRRTGLTVPYLNAWIHRKEMPKFSFEWLLIAITFSFFGSLLIIVFDQTIFMRFIDMPEQVNNITWWHGLLAMFYGGITEELMVRLFAMTFIVWLLAVITKRQAGNIPTSFYIIGILGATLLFGLGHLPATLKVFGELTPILVVRGLFLNGLLGIFFGYLYYKKGLEYAIIAHLSADLFLHVIINPLFG